MNIALKQVLTWLFSGFGKLLAKAKQPFLWLAPTPRAACGPTRCGPSPSPPHRSPFVVFDHYSVRFNVSCLKGEELVYLVNEVGIWFGTNCEGKVWLARFSYPILEYGFDTDTDLIKFKFFCSDRWNFE